MINYFDIFCNILDSVTNNEHGTFAYEVTGYEEPWEGQYNEIWEAHVMYIYPEELETAKAVFNRYDGSIIDDEYRSVKTVLNAHRINMHMLTDKMITKYFNSESFSDIYDHISVNWDHVYTNNMFEEFYSMNGVYVVFDKNGDYIFFGNTKTELTECILEPESDDADADEDDC
jgi:hypothetical protein